MAYRGKYPNRINGTSSTNTKGVYLAYVNNGARFFFAARDCRAAGYTNDAAQLIGHDVSEFDWLQTTAEAAAARQNPTVLPIGTLVLSINGESDTDAEGKERTTGPRAWGYIAEYSPRCGYSVYFTNGTTVFIEHDELEERDEYDVVTPEVMASRMNELQRHDATIQRCEDVPTGDDFEAAIGIVGIAR